MAMAVDVAYKGPAGQMLPGTSLRLEGLTFIHMTLRCFEEVRHSLWMLHKVRKIPISHGYFRHIQPLTYNRGGSPSMRHVVAGGRIISHGYVKCDYP